MSLKKYEFKFLDEFEMLQENMIDSNRPSFQVVLREAGLYGWQIISVNQWYSDKDSRFYRLVVLQREINGGVDGDV